MISCESLTCGFSDAVIQNVNIQLNANEIVIFLGPNGAGKSCLIQTMCGVLKPLAGNVSGLSESFEARAKQVSYAAQHPISLSELSVRSYLDLITPCDKENQDFIFTELEVKSLFSKPIAKLSGGERQRVRLAATLAQHSQVYLLDEPTTSLDPKPISSLVRVIKHLKSNGRSFGVVTHDLGFALEIADRYVGIKEQTIAFDCTKEQLREDNLLNSIFERDFKWQQVDGGAQWLVY